MDEVQAVDDFKMWNIMYSIPQNESCPVVCVRFQPGGSTVCPCNETLSPAAASLSFKAKITLFNKEQAGPGEIASDLHSVIEASWNVMAHAQKSDFVYRRNGRVRLNRRGRQFSRLLAAEVCASALVMMDTPCSEVVRRVLATNSIRQFPLPCVTVCHHMSTELYPHFRLLWFSSGTAKQILTFYLKLCKGCFLPHLLQLIIVSHVTHWFQKRHVQLGLKTEKTQILVLWY